METEKVYSQNQFAEDIIERLKTLVFDNTQFHRSINTLKLKKKICAVASGYKDLHIWAGGVEKEMKEKDNVDITHICGHEWLYDLIIYRFRQNEHYALNHTILTMESEWGGLRPKNKRNDGNDYYGEVKFDFQKLLVSNADILLMVYKQQIKKESNAVDNELNQYFQKTIDNCQNVKDNSIFVFAKYIDSDSPHFLIHTYQKKGVWK